MKKLTKAKIKRIMQAQDKWKAWVKITTKENRDKAMEMIINKFRFDTKGVYYTLTKNYSSDSSQTTYDDLRALKEAKNGKYTLANMPSYNSESENYLQLKVTLEDLK